MSELLTFFQFEFFDFPLDDPVRNNFSQGAIAPAFGYFDHVDNRQKFGEQKEQKDKHSYTGKGQKPFYRRYTIVYIFRSHVLQRKQGSFQCWDDDQVSFYPKRQYGYNRNSCDTIDRSESRKEDNDDR